MSAYKEIRTEFRNLESLKKALADVGFGKFHLSSGPKVNDFETMGYHRPGEKVALCLKKSDYNAFEDTGFAWDAKTQTYRAIISTHDGVDHYGNQTSAYFGEGTLKKVQQRYAFHEVKRQAAVKGYTVREIAGGDGTIRLQLTHR